MAAGPIVSTYHQEAESNECLFPDHLFLSIRSNTPACGMLQPTLKVDPSTSVDLIYALYCFPDA